MADDFVLDWQGNRAFDLIVKGVIAGMDATMADCVPTAKENTPVITGILQGSIRFEPAKRVADAVVGVWGSFDVNYAFPVEVGTRFREGRNMLRGSADRHHPEMPENISRETRRLL